MSQIAVIITAGGIGTRMGTERPKQFLELDGLPIIVLTFKRFLSVLPEVKFYLTLPHTAFEEWDKIHKKYLPALEVKLVEGGETRFSSVHNALQKVTEDLVCIHDAVRPFINGETILETIKKAKESRAAIVTVSLKDSIRELNDKSSNSVDRKNYCLVQTPQVFNSRSLKEAYNKAELSSKVFTDDASVWERYEGPIELIAGSHENIKITLPEDIEIGRAILKFQNVSNKDLA